MVFSREELEVKNGRVQGRHRVAQLSPATLHKQISFRHDENNPRFDISFFFPLQAFHGTIGIARPWL